jgi:hypothetical protein
MVCTSKALLDEGGIDALRTRGGKGRPAQLDTSELARLRRSLLKLRATARNKLKSAQHLPSIIMACWKQTKVG